jgi:hypothetical protein
VPRAGHRRPGRRAHELLYGHGRPASLIDAEDNLSLLGHDGHDRHLWTQYPVATKGAGAGNPNDWDGVE